MSSARRSARAGARPSVRVLGAQGLSCGRPMEPAKRLSEQDLNLILEHTASLWDEVRGQRIFITGGTGFFGCWLVESFCHINRALGLDATMVVLSRAPATFAAKCP